MGVLRRRTRANLNNTHTIGTSNTRAKRLRLSPSPPRSPFATPAASPRHSFSPRRSPRLGTPNRRNSPRRPSPSPGPAPGPQMTVTLYTGQAAQALIRKAAVKEMLVDRCTTYDASGQVARDLESSYITQEFTPARTSKNFMNSYKIKTLRGTYVLLATLGDGTVAGYIKGTAFTAYRGVPGLKHVLVVDLFCSGGRTKTYAGGVMMKELLRLAQAVGASLVLLFSVKDPNTVGFYRKYGFERTANACGGHELNAQAANAWLKLKAAGFRHAGYGRANKEYKDAMAQKFYKDLNAFGDTVLMSKCIGSASAGNGRVQWLHDPTGAVFNVDSQRLGVYGGTPWTRM